MRWLALLQAIAFTFSAAHAEGAIKTVVDYLADGYTIAEKREEEHRLPGKPPYEQLERVVHVTTYRLERNGDAVTCEVAYDSQQDSIATICR